MSASAATNDLTIVFLNEARESLRLTTSKESSLSWLDSKFADLPVGSVSSGGSEYLAINIHYSIPQSD